MNGAFLKGLHAQRTVVDTQTFPCAFACDGQNIGRVQTGCIASHELHNDLMQIVHLAGALVIAHTPLFKHKFENHALAKAFRVVGHVMTRQAAENTVNSLRKEFLPGEK